jgi:hypothetical protein
MLLMAKNYINQGTTFCNAIKLHVLNNLEVFKICNFCHSKILLQNWNSFEVCAVIVVYKKSDSVETGMYMRAQKYQSSLDQLSMPFICGYSYLTSKLNCIMFATVSEPHWSSSNSTLKVTLRRRLKLVFNRIIGNTCLEMNGWSF